MSPLKNELTVVVDSLGVESEVLIPFVNRVHKVASDLTEDSSMFSVLLSVYAIDEQIITNIEGDIAAGMYPEGVSMIISDEGTFATAYLRGLQKAALLSEIVIELDSGGGHMPEEIRLFYKALKSETDQIAFSSRFINGSENLYPVNRRIISNMVTLMSKFLLGTGSLSDAASGFQGFRSDVLTTLFEKYPIESGGWVSAEQGPFHLYQTEIRYRLISLLEEYNWSYSEVPIKYGVEKVGQQLPVNYLLHAIKGFMLLAENYRKRR